MILPKKWQVCIMLFLATTLNYLDRPKAAQYGIPSTRSGR